MINLKSLNNAQKLAVEYDEGPEMVVAGAGSGKTKVLTYKIAWLIEHGYDPGCILALTFTNKAANEMKSRIKELIGSRAESLWMGTFHSIFARILRMEAKCLNYRSNFSIYDAEDSGSLVSNIFSTFNINSDLVTPNSVKHRISYLKNQMIMPAEFRKKYADAPSTQQIAEIFEEYQSRLRENNAMDFEDLLLKPIELFNHQPKVHQKYRKKFSYILVDEFQDTNKAQYELVKMLVTREGKVCVVGDDAQSIYSWRGANIGNMLDFEKDFPKHKIFRLEQNYRSTKYILQAADSVIKNNSNQIAKTLWTENNDGELLTLVKCSDEKDEAYQIAKYIKNEISRKKLSLKDFAILYRTNAQSRALEDIFRREKIPYRIIGGVEFYRRKEVKDVVAYLRVISNQNDEESLLRIMNFPQRGIGLTTIKRMIAFARKHNISMFETMTRVFEVIDIKERIQKNVKGFKLLLDKYIDLKDKLSVGELSRALVDELGLLRMFKEENTPESLVRWENINELLSALSEFSSSNQNAKLEQYLEEVSLIADIDMYEEGNAVTMLTIHSAKGLEFPIVFISGCEEDIFPLSNKFSAEAQLEEERRLFYVAITRAKKKVYLTHARSRYRFGEVAYQSRSRFIDELDPKTYSEVNGSIGRKSSARKSKKEMYYEYFENVDYEDFDQDNKSLRPGSRVMHEKFGLGKVTLVTGAGDMQKATVVFEGNNVKQLMLKFAKLKVL